MCYSRNQHGFYFLGIKKLYSIYISTYAIHTDSVLSVYVDDQERWNGFERCDEGVESEGDDDGAVQDTTDGNIAFIHMPL